MVLVTRSKRVLEAAFDETKSSRVIKSAKIAKTDGASLITKSPKTPKTPRTPKTTSSKTPTKSPKVNLEEYLSEKFPETYPGELPEEFVNYHVPEFVKGCTYILERDPSLYSVIVYKNFLQFENAEEKLLKDEETIRTYWYSLISSVIAQQISGSAAQSIEAKFRALFNGEVPTPSKTLTFSYEELRALGLSNMKVKYVQHISEEYSNKECILTSVDFYKTATVEELTEELCKLKGIGEWSAKMFILFTLKNMNVFAHEDLGIARGMARYLQKRPSTLLQAKKLCEAEEFKKLLSKKAKFASKQGSKSKRDWVPIHDVYVKSVGELFDPYQSVFMLILWRISTTNINVLENTGIRHGDEVKQEEPNAMVELN